MTLSHVMGIRYNKIKFFLPSPYFELACGRVRGGKSLTDKFPVVNGLEKEMLLAIVFNLIWNTSLGGFRQTRKSFKTEWYILLPSSLQ